MLAGAEIQASNRSSSFEIESAHGDMLTALNTSLGNIELVIRRRIKKWVEIIWINIHYLYVQLISIILFQINDDQYSISLEKKLKKHKEMCENNSKSLEKPGNYFSKLSNNGAKYDVQIMVVIFFFFF